MGGTFKDRREGGTWKCGEKQGCRVLAELRREHPSQGGLFKNTSCHRFDRVTCRCWGGEWGETRGLSRLFF